MENNSLGWADLLKFQSPELIQIFKMSSEMMVCDLSAPIAAISGYEKWPILKFCSDWYD